MICAYCNTEIPDGSRFCPICGARLSESTPVSAPPASDAKDILSDIQANAPAAAAWQSPAQTPKAETWSQPASSWSQPQTPKTETYSQPASSWSQPQTPKAETWSQPASGWGQQAPKADSYSQQANSWGQPQTPKAESYSQPASAWGQQQTPKAETYVPPVNAWDRKPEQTYTQPASNSWSQPQTTRTDYGQPANNWDVTPAKPQVRDNQLSAKKGSKKGLVIGLCAAAVVLVGAVIAFLLFSGKPLPKALKGTGDALEQMLGAGNLGKINTNLSKLNKDQQLTETLDLSAKQGSDMNVNLGLALDLDTKQQMTSGKLTVSGDLGGSKTDFVLRLFGDTEELQLAVDGVDGTYGTTYQALMEKMGVEDFQLDSSKIQPLTKKDLQNGPLKPILDSIKDEEKGQTRIVTDGGEKICKHYVVTWDEAEVEKLLKSYEDSVEGFSREDFSSLSQILTEKGNLDAVSAFTALIMSYLKPSQDVYINSNRIIGLDLYAKEDDAPVYVRLLGKDNVWEHVRLQQNSSETKIDCYWEKGKEIRLCTTLDDKEVEVLKYNDADGRITVNEELIGTKMPDIFLKPTDKGAALTVEAGGELLGMDGASLQANLEMGPMAQAPAKLAESYKDLTKMSDDELQELLSKVMEKLGSLGMMAGSLGGGLGGSDWVEDDFGGDDWGLGEEDWDLDNSNGTPDADPETAYSGTLDPDKVFGSYDFAYIEASGMKFDAEDMGFTDECYVTLWSDGTGVFVWEGESAKINWKINGNKIEITDRDTDSEIYEMIYSEEGNLMIDADGSGYLVFVRDE